MTVPAGTPHKFWNAGDDEAHFVCEVRPALQFEQLLETMFALAADGKTNRKGMPNPLRLAVIAQRALRRRAAAVPARLDAAARARPRRAARPAARLRARLRPGGRRPGRERRMKRYLFWSLLVLALIVLAAGGFVARALRPASSAE